MQVVLRKLGGCYGQIFLELDHDFVEQIGFIAKIWQIVHKIGLELLTLQFLIDSQW